MAVRQGFLRFVLDQLDLLGEVSSRRMFGGVGLYCRGTFFAILFDDLLYLKVNDGNRRDFLAAKMEPFRPYPDRPSTTFQYYRVPADVLEDRKQLAAWAAKAVEAAAAARASRRKGAARKGRRQG